MGLINILDAQTANMIAAGEVVERPSSAAKEMLENSIDAGAKSITLEIKNGGRSLVRVSDDGHGFLREDIPKALLRHATSKISCGDDIYGIRSLGFRGEALAAIGAVSRLDIISKHRSEEMGTRLTADENGIVMVDTGCPDGTTVSMRDIFYNTPARQKFLKKDGSEGASCVAAAEKLALSHPEISFTVISDGERKFTTAGDGKLFPAIYAVFGREFANSLVKAEYVLDGITVNGFITTPDKARKSRAMQTVFINGRYVKSKTVQAALEEAYRSFIPRGSFPGCVLFVTLDPCLTDVNVHPAKTEIKFASERDVFRAVYYAVKTTLEADPAENLLVSGKNTAQSAAEAQPVDKNNTENGGNASTVKIVPNTNFTPEKNAFNASNISNTANNYTPKTDIANTQPAFQTAQKQKTAFRADIGEDDLFDSNSQIIFRDSGAPEAVLPQDNVQESADGAVNNTPAATPAFNTDPEPENEQLSLAPSAPAWRVIGQAYDAYIFVQTEDNILVIDKHAAHERILYERLAANKQLHVQELLAGIPVSVGRQQAAILLENSDFLEEKGFKIEDFGEGSIIVRTVPMTLSSVKGLNGILEDFAKILSEGNSLSFEERCDRALYTVACKAALKAGIKNRPEDDENVVKMLAENPHLRFCPHGRPFIKTIPRREIEKFFDR